MGEGRRLALIGMGRMGQLMIHEAPGHAFEIVHTVSREENRGDRFRGDWVDGVDVVVDFSAPEAAPENIERAVRSGLPVVEGTTGWDEHRDRIRRLVEESDGAVVWASNFSPAVQILFQLVEQASRSMARAGIHQPWISETHHSRKVDSPSGTALSLQARVREQYPKVPVTATRVGHFPGTHEVGFDSPVDTLTLRHQARSRTAFVQGVFHACRWIVGRRGFYEYREVFFEDE